jgi:hypothetical protein
MIADRKGRRFEPTLRHKPLAKALLAPVFTGRWVVFRRADLVGRTVTVKVRR